MWHLVDSLIFKPPVKTSVESSTFIHLTSFLWSQHLSWNQSLSNGFCPDHNEVITIAASKSQTWLKHRITISLKAEKSRRMWKQLVWLQRGRRKCKCVSTGDIIGLNVEVWMLGKFIRPLWLGHIRLWTNSRLHLCLSVPSSRRHVGNVLNLILFTARHPADAGCKCTNCHDWGCVWNLIAFHTRSLCPQNSSNHDQQKHKSSSFRLMNSWEKKVYLSVLIPFTFCNKFKHFHPVGVMCWGLI